MKIVGHMPHKNWFSNYELAMLKLAGYTPDHQAPTNFHCRTASKGEGPRATIECCKLRDRNTRSDIRCFSVDIWPGYGEDSAYIYNDADLKKVIIHADNELARGKP